MPLVLPRVLTRDRGGNRARRRGCRSKPPSSGGTIVKSALPGKLRARVAGPRRAAVPQPQAV